MTQAKRWSELLVEWSAEGQSLWVENRDRWRSLGLPPIEALRIVQPDVVSAAALGRRFTTLVDPDVTDFYSITDGWPLWLGSFWSGIAPVSRIGLFRHIYPEAFDIAQSSAPSERESELGEFMVTKHEIHDAIVLSEPDSRELVLSLPSGKTCLYLFDSIRIFPNLFDFMVYQKRATFGWVREVLSS